jgi:hypothetical protein
MEVKPRHHVVQTKRLVDDGRMFHVVDYSFKLDEVKSIAQDHRIIPGHGVERSIITTPYEVAVVFINQRALSDLWNKLLKETQVITFTNYN